MALLTRSRPRSTADRASAAAAEAIERARDVAGPTVERARDAAGPAVERARDAAGPAVDRAREAAAPTVERAREATAPAVERAREVAGPAVERAREASEPTLAQLRSAIATFLRMAVRVAALLPGFGAQVLEAVATLMGRLADTSAEIAHVKPPSKVGRRRRAGLWFAGGFVTGAAAGYVAHEYLSRDFDDEYEDDLDDEGPWVTVDEDSDQAPSERVPG